MEEGCGESLPTTNRLSLQPQIWNDERNEKKAKRPTNTLFPFSRGYEVLISDLKGEQENQREREREERKPNFGGPLHPAL